MKHVYKLTPTSLYHLPELEFWLEEMALEGLYPTKIGSYFTRFQHGEPKKMRFRLESAEQDHEISPGKLDFYRESGWNHVCPVEKMYHLFCCGDDTAPELHTDPVTRSLSMETLNRKVRQYRIFTLLKPLLMVLIITIPLFLVEWNISTEYPWIDAPNYIARMPLVLVDLSFLLLLFPYLFWSWLRTLHHCRVLTNLQKQLSEGLTVTPLPRKNSWKWMNEEKKKS